MEALVNEQYKAPEVSEMLVSDFIKGAVFITKYNEQKEYWTLHYENVYDRGSSLSEYKPIELSKLRGKSYSLRMKEGYSDQRHIIYILYEYNLAIVEVDLEKEEPFKVSYIYTVPNTKDMVSY